MKMDLSTAISGLPTVERWPKALTLCREKQMAPKDRATQNF